MSTIRQNVTAAALSTMLIASVAQHAQGAAAAAAPKPTKDIVDTAVEAGSFNTLVTAVKAAGLVETLKSPGPFTVFAPTDAAFAKLPAGTVEKLLAQPEKLKAILTYHVVPGKVEAAKVVTLPLAKTVNGAPVFIKVEGGVVRLNGVSRVAKADVQATNGVIHVIDTVILPLNIPETAKQAGKFSTLLKAVEAAGLVEALSGEGPLTLFAPTDEAFAKLPAGTLDALLADKAKLTAVLTYHVASGKLTADKVAAMKTIPSLQGSPIPVDASTGVKVDGASVVMADVLAANGVIHVIDTVILPD